MGETRNVPEKLIDTWTYKVKDVTIDRLDYVEAEDPANDERERRERYAPRKERITNKAVTINIYAVKRTTQSEEPPHPLDTITLLVKCPELNLKLEGTDIAALKDALWSMLDKKFEIKWEQYYLVEVNETRIYHGSGKGLEIVYDDVYKGTTWDGKNLLRRWRGYEYKIEVWPGAFKDEHGKVMACIPVNEENSAALKEFCARIGVLREKLADFLKPDVIQQNLARLAGLRLLPPVPKQVEESDADESSDAVTEAEAK